MTHLARTASSFPRPVRGAVVVLLACVVAALPLGGEARAATKVPADRSAWFWMSNEKVTVEDVGGHVAPGVSIGGGAYGNTGANPISPGHLGVAMRNGQPDMRAYVHFNTNAIPLGATINKFVASFTVSRREAGHSEQHSEARGRTPATTNDDAAAIKACVMRESWGDNVSTGGGGDPPASTTVEDPTVTPEDPPKARTQANEPEADCSVSVRGKRSADGSTWTFDLTAMAQMWFDGTLPVNEGIALIPVEASVNPTWIIELHGPALKLDTDTGTNEVVPPSLAPYATVDFTGGALPPPPPPPPPTTGIGPGTVTFPSFGNPTPPANGTSQTPPATTAPPTQGPSVPIAFSAPTSAWFLAMFLLGLAALWWLKSMVGSDQLGLTAAAATNKVAMVLHERRLAGADTVAAVAAIKEEELAETTPE